jgi:hypothetical protein
MGVHLLETNHIVKYPSNVSSCRKEVSLLLIELNAGTNLQIGALFKFLAALEKRELLRFDCHFFTGLGVSASVAFVGLDKKAAQASDFHTLPARHGLCHVIEKNLDHSCGLGPADICFRLQF